MASKCNRAGVGSKSNLLYVLAATAGVKSATPGVPRFV
jgi:hypothetical protein